MPKEKDSEGATSKKWYFWLVHTTNGARPHLLVKNYHFLFLLPFDPEASKTCNNRKTFNVCVLPLSANKQATMCALFIVGPFDEAMTNFCQSTFFSYETMKEMLYIDAINSMPNSVSLCWKMLSDRIQIVVLDGFDN